MRGSSLLRTLLALCAATALVVLPGLQVAQARSVSERRAPSTRASAGGGPSTSASASELGALLQLDRRWRLPGKEGAGGAQRRDSAASTDRGRQQSRRATQQRTGSPLELYLYEGPNVAAVTSGAGVAGVERRFLYDGVDHPLWMWDRVADAGVYFELDCIGNVRRLRGGARYGAGAALPSDLGGYKYSAFGRSVAADAGTPAPVVDGVGFNQPLRWQGRWLDTATGIYDVRNRQWSPELGAFLSPDDFVFFQEESTLWGWPGQNPAKFRDPSGRNPFLILIGAGFVAGSASSSGAPGLEDFSSFALGLNFLGAAAVAEAISAGAGTALLQELGILTRAGATAGAGAGAAAGGKVCEVARGAAPDVLAEIAKGRSMQAAVQALNRAGASQPQAVRALEQVVANASKELLVAEVQGAPGSIALTGVQFAPGGLTKVIVVDANGIATYGSAIANYVNGVLTISEFVPGG